MSSLLKKRSLVIVVLILAFLITSVYSEGQMWNCPECGRIGNTGNYCGSCAHPAPWIEIATSYSATSTPSPTPNPTPTPITDTKVEGLSLMFSELDHTVKQLFDNALLWDKKTAPQKLEDFPLLPYNLAESVKLYSKAQYKLEAKDGLYVLSLALPDQLIHNFEGMENASIGLWVKHGQSAGTQFPEVEKIEGNKYYIRENSVQFNDGGSIVGCYISKHQSSNGWTVNYSISLFENKDYTISCWFSSKKFDIFWETNKKYKECKVSMSRSEWVSVDSKSFPGIKARQKFRQYTILSYDFNSLKIQDVSNDGADEWIKYIGN